MPTVDPEFKNLCPPLKAEELAGLRESLHREGLKHPIEVWDGIILDGHNRFDLCQELGIKMREQPVQDPAVVDRPSAINWIIANQLARRNLTPLQASYLRGKRYETEKVKLGSPEKAEVVRKGHRTRVSAGGGQIVNHQAKTQDVLGKELGVTGRTVHRDYAFARGIDRIKEAISPGEAEAVKAGKIKLTKEQVAKIGRAKSDKEAKQMYEDALKPKPKHKPPTRAQVDKNLREQAQKAPMSREEMALWKRWQAFAHASDYMSMAAQGDVKEFARWARSKEEVWKWVGMYEPKLRWISSMMTALLLPRE